LVGFLDTRSLGMDGLMGGWEAALFLFLLGFFFFFHLCLAGLDRMEWIPDCCCDHDGLR